jgi:hypothetical protein
MSGRHKLAAWAVAITVLAISVTAHAQLEPESNQYDVAAEIRRLSPPVPDFGPVPVEQIGILADIIGKDYLDSWGLQTWGWLEGGYTGASTGPGLLAVQPRQNRFGNEFLFNQLGFSLMKPVSSDEFDIGFKIRYFAGADAAIGQPKGGIDDAPGNDRFSHDFRDLEILAHLPILTEGGMDVKIGRMNTVIGYNGFLAPWRPFYSSDYQFFYSQDGAFTGFLTNLHLTDRLSMWNGMTLGANTFFTKRSSDSYCYLGQINYWVTDEKRTRLTASLHLGPDAIFAAPGMAGTFDTIVELRVLHHWNDCLMQVVQSNMGWDVNTPVGTGQWYGLYTILSRHLTPTLDLQGRAEWFTDVGGTRTGVDADYAQCTLGFNWHPTTDLEIRPEIRGDFADAPAFGNNNTPTQRNQVTGVVSALLKF